MQCAYIHNISAPVVRTGIREQQTWHAPGQLCQRAMRLIPSYAGHTYTKSYHLTRHYILCAPWRIHICICSRECVCTMWKLALAMNARARAHNMCLMCIKQTRVQTQHTRLGSIVHTKRKTTAEKQTAADHCNREQARASTHVQTHTLACRRHQQQQPRQHRASPVSALRSPAFIYLCADSRDRELHVHLCDSYR